MANPEEVGKVRLGMDTPLPDTVAEGTQASVFGTASSGSLRRLLAGVLAVLLWPI